jgi:PEP-CTERM motif
VQPLTSTLRTALFAMLLSYLAMAARAEVSIEAWLTDFSCSFTDSSGISVGIPCSGPTANTGAAASVTVGLSPGESVHISATLNIVYEDDGLRLITPTPYFSGTDLVGTLFTEAGLIYVRTARTDCIALRSSCTIDAIDSLPFPLVVGNNSFAESLQQQISVVSDVVNFNAPNPPGSFPHSFTATAFLGVPLAIQVQSPITPVPEPSTSALLVAGLLAVWFVYRGRRDRFLTSASASRSTTAATSCRVARS